MIYQNMQYVYTVILLGAHAGDGAQQLRRAHGPGLRIV